MRSPATTPQAAPVQGAAPTATKQRRAQLLALIDKCHARDQAAQRRSGYAVAQPLSPEQQQYEPSTDPTRWQGFL
jgi:hypothetical protein